MVFRIVNTDSQHDRFPVKATVSILPHLAALIDDLRGKSRAGVLRFFRCLPIVYTLSVTKICVALSLDIDNFLTFVRLA
jgi:hypothetical protein